MPEKEKTATLTESEAMTEILKRAIPKDLQERVKELEEGHESNFRLHPEAVAVLDISTAASPIMDGTPGFYDVVTGTDKDRETRGDEAKAEFTKQGLRITDRYEVVLNQLPVQERIFKYTVVPREEWEEHAKSKPTGMLTSFQEVAGQMRRAGGTA